MANGPHFAISVNNIGRSYRPNSRDLRGSTAAICPVFRLCARPPTAPLIRYPARPRHTPGWAEKRRIVRRNSAHPRAPRPMAGKPGRRSRPATGGRAAKRPATPLPSATTMATETGDVVTMDKIVALCKRRGFLFQSSEIYGGLGSTYDYGHYGVLLKTNVKNEWWRAMIQQRDDIVALDSAIILHPKTWEASGHLSGFSDPLVQCLGKCKQRFREDHLREAQPEGELKCPVCGGELPPPRHFNLMFKTHHGPVEDEGSEVYLRPETAQGIFLNFKNALQTSRKKPPFGIAQVGKSFRNEITPGNFIFRTREFEQMEMEFFVPPDEAPKWY